MGNITMSRKEIQQIPVFEKLLDNKISQKAAAKVLRITDRQVRNKLRRYEQQGARGLVHRSRGRPSTSRWNTKERDFAIDLLQREYRGFGPTFATEKLQDQHNISVSKETLRKEMIKAGMWACKARKPVYRSRRPRKLNFGKMVQVDGSPHDWFEGRASKCTLLVFIDDATSKIVWLHFAESESTESLMRAAKEYVAIYGRPLSIYVDFGGVFSVNTNNPERDKITQFGRAMKELGIEVKYAHSPQAKGRVERANGILQDRLVKEMRLAKINSIEAANKFVQEKYLPAHNEKFAVKPEAKQDLHRSVDDFDLDNVFCFKSKRVLQNDFVIRYKNRLLQLHKEQRTIIRPKDRIVVSEAMDGKVSLHIRKTQLDFKEILDRPARLRKEQVRPHTPSFWKPPANHPWRRYGAATNSYNRRKEIT